MVYHSVVGPCLSYIGFITAKQLARYLTQYSGPLINHISLVVSSSL
jgi:hypothetical protein